MDSPKDTIQDYTFTCKGGLDNQNTYVELAENTPGAALQLVNFEPSIYGGYRRINGFSPLNDSYTEVDSVNAEGKVLGVFIYQNEIYAARKQQSGTTYKIYRFDSGSGWVAQSPGFTLNTTDGTYTVTRVSYDTFSLSGTDMIIFADGVNYAYMFDGTTWTQIKSTNTGADYANAGGNQVLDKPSLVEIYQNHIFLSGDPTASGVICHSSPSLEYDWLVANGAGQIVAGFDINQIKVWRDFMYVFGLEDIGYVGVSSTNFVFKSVTTTVGCIAPFSVVETDGDLLYLSQGGFRTIAGTDKINDVEINVVSKKVLGLTNTLTSTYTSNDVVGYTIPSKSQVRFTWNLSTVSTADTRGVIGGIREDMMGNRSWEWGELLGISTYVATSGRVSGIEYVIHGDYSGNVFRQEIGNDFNGANIPATYTTPHLDFGTPLHRKMLRDIFVFIRSEGTTDISYALSYNWDDKDKLVPPTEVIAGDERDTTQYGDGTQYGDVGATYGAGVYPLFAKSIRGTCQSVKISFTTSGMESPYTIQTIFIQYSGKGRR